VLRWHGNLWYLLHPQRAEGSQCPGWFAGVTSPSVRSTSFEWTPARAIAVVFAISAAKAQSTKRVDITDPVLRMKASSYSIPANWNYEDRVGPGSSCVNAATPFWRASSPDGLSGVKLLPRVDWSWSSRPLTNAPPASDCLPLTQIVKARDFIAHMLPVLQVEFVRENTLARRRRWC
jgi:hypothetical protein